MNPGFLSYILLTVSLILIAFGWRAQAIGSGSAGAAGWFCGAWLAGAAIDWQAGTASGTLVYLPLLALAATGFAASAKSGKPGKETAAALSFGCLLGAVYSLLELLETFDPLLMMLHPMIDPVALAGLLIVAYSRNAALQLSVWTIALIVNDAYMAMLYAEYRQPSFGGRTFQDVWWIGAVSIRAASVWTAWAVSRIRREGVRLRGRLRVRR